MARMTIALLAMTCGTGLALTTEQKANPIRKVVTMLQMMQSKITAEGEKEAELYEKYVCWCKNGAGALTKSIADAEAKIPKLQAEIEASESKKTQPEEDVKQHKA